MIFPVRPDFTRAYLHPIFRRKDRLSLINFIKKLLQDLWIIYGWNPGIILLFIIKREISASRSVLTIVTQKYGHTSCAPIGEKLSVSVSTIFKIVSNVKNKLSKLKGSRGWLRYPITENLGLRAELR